MLQLLILLIVLVPVVELTILVKLGGWIGWLPTIALVLGAGVAGTALARHEGWKAARRVQQQLAQGVTPAAEMLDGFLIGLAGVLLLLPGILSDIVGLLLLLPPTRKLARLWILHWMRTKFRVQVVGGPSPDGQPAMRDEIIDARVIETRVVD